MNVLFIDDCAELFVGFRRAFAEHQVRCCATQQEAIAAIVTGFRPHVIFCDVFLGAELGTDFHRWLEQHHPALVDSFVFMSGAPEDQLPTDLPAGRELLRKPFSLGSLEKLAHRLGTPAAE